MKHLIFAFLIVSLFALTNCKKETYLDDGGTHSALTSLSNYDYLTSHPYRYFDTVLLIIDHFNLKDSVNKAGTFFAPTDFAVQNLMTALKITRLDSLYGRITSRFLTQYMFSDTAITLDKASLTTKVYNNWADTIAGIRKVAQTYGTAATAVTYYTLQYVKINGYPDGTPGIPDTDREDAILNTQTTGIKTSSGNTTLHILANISSLYLR